MPSATAAQFHFQQLLIGGDAMAISHELSGEIAAALFSARERSATELQDLKQIVFQIYSTLEQLTKEEKMSRIGGGDQTAKPRLVRVKSAGQES